MPTKPWNAGIADPETVGKPDGPMKFIPEFGFEVGTFTQTRADLYKHNDTGKTSLMHHVPHMKRGYYKPEQTADYDEDEYEYITDDNGYAICTAKKLDGTPCSKRAMHMSWLCGTHGGKLHPLDKVVNDDRNAMRTKEGGYGVIASPDVIERMTRFQKLCQGIISVEDLDDEELARGQCRGKDGRFSANPPRMIPKAVHDRMVSELFNRADEKLKQNLLDVVDTMTSIAKGTAYEPADRIKAATWVFERVRGKNPDVVVHQQDKPWELALSAISTTTRAESRIARGLDPETGEKVMDVPQLSLPGETPEQKRQRLLAELAELDGEYLAHLEDEEEYADGEYIDAEVVSEPNEYLDEDDELPKFLKDKGFQPGSATGETAEELVHMDEPSHADIVEADDIANDEEKFDPDKAERHQESVQELKDRLNAGRRQRAHARKVGSEKVEATPFMIAPAGKAPGGVGYFVGFKKMPTPSKRRGNDDYRHRI